MLGGGIGEGGMLSPNGSGGIRKSESSDMKLKHLPKGSTCQFLEGIEAKEHLLDLLLDASTCSLHLTSRSAFAPFFATFQASLNRPIEIQ